MKEKGFFFFVNNVSRPSNPPDELAKNVSKKIPFGRIVPPFFLRKFRILPCFQLFTLFEFDFSGRGELNQKGFSGAQYWSLTQKQQNTFSIDMELAR